MQQMQAAARAMTKTELIYDVLRRGILTLVYRPGTYLNIDELARRNHVSPIPVREALARLVEERLVVIRPHFGAEVAPLDETAVREVFAFLEGLETAAAEDLVARVLSADIAALEEILGEIDDLRLPADLAARDKANAAFHIRLVTIAALPGLLEQLRRGFDHWDRVRRYFSEISSNRGGLTAQKEHRAMLSALKRKDGDLLRKLLHLHNARARRVYLDGIAKMRCRSKGT